MCKAFSQCKHAIFAERNQQKTLTFIKLHMKCERNTSLVTEIPLPMQHGI